MDGLPERLSLECYSQHQCRSFFGGLPMRAGAWRSDGWARGGGQSGIRGKSLAEMRRGRGEEGASMK